MITHFTICKDFDGWYRVEAYTKDDLLIAACEARKQQAAVDGCRLACERVKHKIAEDATVEKLTSRGW